MPGDEDGDRLSGILGDAEISGEVIQGAHRDHAEGNASAQRDGREQRYFQAKPAPGMAQPAAWVLEQLAQAMGLAEVS